MSVKLLLLHPVPRPGRILQLDVCAALGTNWNALYARGKFTDERYMSKSKKEKYLPCDNIARATRAAQAARLGHAGAQGEWNPETAVPTGKAAKCLAKTTLCHIQIVC